MRLLMLLCAPALRSAQNDWPLNGNDSNNLRDSPLTQINAERVSRLTPALTQGNPIAYAGKNGKQSVFVGAADSLVAFSVPSQRC